jgi:hypothetical protein
MSIVEELAEYLTYILGLNETTVEDILGTYNEYSSKIS